MIEINNYIKLPLEQRRHHLNLYEPCHFRGTNSTQVRGLLAYYLDTTVPQGNKIHCCHACENENCSNPNHLYWGTASENRKEAFAGKYSEFYKKQISVRMSGNNNPNFDIKPWKNNILAFNTEAINAWSKADYVYNKYFLKNWDISKYGKGNSYFYSKYRISKGPLQTMFKMFGNGWIPENDIDWMQFFIKQSTN